MKISCSHSKVQGHTLESTVFCWLGCYQKEKIAYHVPIAIQYFMYFIEQTMLSLDECQTGLNESHGRVVHVTTEHCTLVDLGTGVFFILDPVLY